MLRRNLNGSIPPKRNLPVFKLGYMSRYTLDLKKIESLIYSSVEMDENSKRDYFMSYDIDYSKVCEYYDQVVYIEKCYMKNFIS